MFSEGGGAGAGGFKGIIWFLEVVEGGQLSSMEYKWGLQKIGYQLTANGGGGGWVIRMLQSFKGGKGDQVSFIVKQPKSSHLRRYIMLGSSFTNQNENLAKTKEYQQ